MKHPQATATDPTPEEWELIRALVARFGSFLDSDVRKWTRHLKQS